MKWSKVVVIAAWLIGIVLLLSLMFQMQSFASIINNAGVIRGGTQRVVKAEMYGQADRQTTERVDHLLTLLRRDEEQRLFKDQATYDFIDKINAVQAKWDRIKSEIHRINAGRGSRADLFKLSEEHFELADDMVLSAQRRAEQNFALTSGVSALLVLFTSVLLVLMERSRVKRMREAYYTDRLTGGKNLLAFEGTAQPLILAALPGTYAVAYSNIFNFRFINETYGHEAGDRVIRSFACILENLSEKDEIAAHVNADHFVLLVKNDPERIGSLARTVEAKLRDNPSLHFSELLSCGFGVYPATKPTASIATMISNATAVLKEGHLEDGVAVYDEKFRQTLDRHNRIVQHMPEGVERSEFKLYLQPKVELATGRLVSAEALCRWDSAALGFLSPVSFIPLFERNGLIADLDFHMLDLACRAYPLKAPDGEALTVSVNFSRFTMLQNEFEDRLLAAVAAYGIPHDRLEIEITESMFSVEEENVIRIMESLKRHGFRLSMDDFGTGYSSLNLLRKLPIDVLKIDRGFLSESGGTDRMQSVLKGVVDMASDLGIQTVCEGVETQEQVDMLIGIGCAIGQGFYYSRPLPLDEFKGKYGIA